MSILEKNEFGVYIKPPVVDITGYEEIIGGILETLFSGILEKYGVDETSKMLAPRYNHKILHHVTHLINENLPEDGALTKIDGNAIRSILNEKLARVRGEL